MSQTHRSDTHRPSGATASGSSPGGFRWLLVAAGLLLQFSIGAVYAWSVFGGALEKAEPWQLGKVRAALPFEVTIGMIFIGSYVGGRLQDRRGPRVVALIGGVIYAVGILLASFTNGEGDYWLLILGYGVISGFGLGVAYIVPIAMLQKWFPDRKGLITGLAVGGFGFGAVLTSPVAQALIDREPDDPTSAFLPLGIAYLVMSLAGAAVFRNPPEGFTVPGHEPVSDEGAGSGRDYTQGEALRTPQWYLLTAILTLSVAAGISLISQAKASATDISGYSVGGAAALVGVLAIFNGGGRIVWAAVSDYLGRMRTFAAILLLQGICLIVLPHASNVVLFAVLAAVVYLCYGGTFGTMPATAGDFFGVRNAGAIYGLMLVGWSLGGVIGPLIAAALIGEEKAYTVAYTTIGIIALASVALTFVTKVPAGRRAAQD
ncbi:OFA family MFS transporter [Microbacterium sp. ARD31]|jgi:OFA family oxalate/formate antiporter-like MFS transporter|uniref:L-lactate MFS transporter n=1 Tax=Microbacterium sp. ARD31 TaxID=2962576 RepID=UPI0028811AD1|nr:OFA family MFS transporter [Microbacterium sp. ARD31]MDT0187546.1 OFA family MFS transporter [Microbacterium sp. ARD31]